MCSRCRHFHADPDNKMTPLGFGRCAQLDVWNYRSGSATACYFTPSRFEETRK
jgi:hypothetical protein